MKPPLADCALLALTLVCLVGLSGCGESAELDLGPLAPYLQEGGDGVWRGEYRENAFWLENFEDDGAIRYYYADFDRREAGSRRIGVDLSFDQVAPGGRAGLIYGYDGSSGNYYLITVSPDGEFATYRRDENGVSQIGGSTVRLSGGTQRLEVQERGREIEFLVNGRSMGTLQSAGTGGGAAGIAALGIGRFGFNQYQSTGPATPATAPEPRPGAGSDTSPSQGAFGEPTATGSGIAGSAGSTASSAAANTLTLHTINDEFGFERPLEAYRLSLPANWYLKGSVQWHGAARCPMDLNKLHFMATAPDGSERIEFIPGGTWSWMSLYDANPAARQYQSLECPIKRILDMPAFMQAYIPRIRPNAKIGNTRARPDLVQKAMANVGNLSNDPNQRVHLEVQEVEVSYEVDGKTINELLISTVLFSQIPGPDPYGGMNGVTMVAQSMGTITVANVNAPANRELLGMVGESLEILPDYAQRIESVMENRSQMMAQAFQRRRAAQQQYLASRRAAAAASRSSSSVDTTGSDILDIQFRGWKSRDAMTSAGQSRAVDGIHDRTAFNNTQGQIVYMPTSHSRMYQLPNDVYVGTNDQFFNPVQATGEFGTELGEHDYGW